jgi:hypothetical protein
MDQLRIFSPFLHAAVEKSEFRKKEQGAPYTRAVCAQIPWTMEDVTIRFTVSSAIEEQVPDDLKDSFGRLYEGMMLSKRTRQGGTALHFIPIPGSDDTTLEIALFNGDKVVELWTELFPDNTPFYRYTSPAHLVPATRV